MNALRSLAESAQPPARGQNSLADLGGLLRQVGAQNSRDGMDTVLAHITPEEAAILYTLGGSGRPDPVTGGLHFDDSGDGESSDNGYGGAGGGERDTPGSGSSTGEYGGGGLGSSDAYGIESFFADPVGFTKDMFSVNTTNPGPIGALAGFATGGLISSTTMAAMSEAARSFGDAVTSFGEAVSGSPASSPPGSVDYSADHAASGSGGGLMIPAQPQGLGGAPSGGLSVGSMGLGGRQNALAAMAPQPATSPIFVGSMQRG